MLYSSKHAGIELCLGPFKDPEDRLQKVKEDSERERKAKGGFRQGHTGSCLEELLEEETVI